MVGPFSFWRNIINIDNIGKDYLKDILEDETDKTEEESGLEEGLKNGADSQDIEMDEAARLRLMKIEYRTERSRSERMKAIEQRQEASLANQARGSTPGESAQNTDENISDSSVKDVE